MDSVQLRLRHRLVFYHSNPYANISMNFKCHIR